MAEQFELPEEAIEAMKSVYDGGFVFDVRLANLLAFVEIHYPDFIIIGDDSKYFPTNPKPIFAVVLTTKGKEFIDEL